MDRFFEVKLFFFLQDYFYSYVLDKTDTNENIMYEAQPATATTAGANAAAVLLTLYVAV